MQLGIKLAAMAVTGAASIALGAAAPALATSHAAASHPVTGPEIIAGAVHGKKALANSPVIPLRWRGVVDTRGVISLGGNGPHKGSVKTLQTAAGKLAVKVTAKPQSRQSVNSKTCRFAFAQDIPVKVVGSKSSGAFAGASGPGAVQVSFAATGSRFTSGPNKGQCNPNGKPHAKGAVARFLAALVLTVR